MGDCECTESVRKRRQPYGRDPTMTRKRALINACLVPRWLECDWESLACRKPEAEIGSGQTAEQPVPTYFQSCLLSLPLMNSHAVSSHITCIESCSSQAHRALP